MPPATHVALLRGINLGPKNKLPKQDLVEMFEAAGCEEVRTYIQSGNVVFRASGAVAARVAEDVRAKIKNKHGFDVPVVLRTADELRAVRAGNPFQAEGAEIDSLHVAFLADKPSEDRVAKLDPDRSPGDAFAARGQEIYLHCPDGFGRTKLTNDYFERKLGTISTVRNWKTVTKLAEMLDG